MARRAPPGAPSEQQDLEEEVFYPRARSSEDGSPGRIIAMMVGIVGILLLGSLFWSAVGALFNALGAASASLPIVSPAPTFTLANQPTIEPTRPAVPTPFALVTPEPTTTAPEPITTAPQPTPPAGPTQAPDDAGRAPWILLPQPAPGTKVSPGPVTLEARGRGDAAITDIRIELDGAALATTLEQRSDSIWRGAASTRLAAGQHSAKATVVDEKGRTGSFRWSFEAAP